MARMLSSWTLYVNVQIDNQEPERGHQHASNGFASTLYLFASSQSLLLNLSSSARYSHRNREIHITMLFQSLLSATLALAATATPTPITNQKPILGEHDDPATQQVDLIKE